MKNFKLLSLLLIIALCYSTCKKEEDDDTIIVDLCENVTCLNGGICIEGSCDCPSGFSGENCATYTPVFKRLITETPLELVESGISVDSLHGKIYAGGYIFYVDVNDIMPNREGLVCALANLEDNYEWGCLEEDTELENVLADFVYPEDTALGSKPGDGKMNTEIILAETCSSGSAAAACAAYSDGEYNDWFLPSRGGMFLIYYNLEARGHVDNFGNHSYWTSNEYNATGAWRIDFSGGTPGVLQKQGRVKVRPVRAF